MKGTLGLHSLAETTHGVRSLYVKFDDTKHSNSLCVVLILFESVALCVVLLCQDLKGQHSRRIANAVVKLGVRDGRFQAQSVFGQPLKQPPASNTQSSSPPSVLEDLQSATVLNKCGCVLFTAATNKSIA